MQLAQLQNLCKRDPAAYRDEFLMQLNHFESQLKIFQLKPTSNFKDFQEQATFLSHVASCYKEETKSLPKQLSQLLEQNCGVMEHDLRKTLAKALILLRNRDLITPLEVLQLFFKLFKVPDKPLRELLYNHIVTDIKNLNAKHKNNKINNALQNFMFTMMQDANEVCAKKAIDVMIELYRKRLWNDAKTVNAISLGCLSKNMKILVAALRFFLGGDETNDDLSESDEEKSKAKVMSKTAKEIYIEYHKGSKKTRSKEKKMKTKMQKAKKVDAKKHRQYQPNFAAIDLINDPQGFAEKLFARLPSATERFEVRLMMMNLISRLIGNHKVLLFNFYPYLQKYLGPKQEHITYILSVLAQSCHDLVPSEILEPVIRTLADKFVHDRCSPEVIAIGEICMRCPLAIDQDLLQDLVKYKENKDKGVIMAARSLINFYRTTYPAMLNKKDRGKGHNIEARPLAYGEMKVSSGVEGIELLEKYKEKKSLNPDEDSSDLEESNDEGEFESGEEMELSEEDGNMESVESDEEGNEMEGDNDEDEDDV